MKPPAVAAGFRIERLIGAGSVGSVYEATQLSLDRKVALRLIERERFRDPDFRGRFERQQRLLADVHHPHIVPTYGAGSWEGGRYIAMRLVRGASLARLEAEGRPPPVAVLEPVAEALAAAHAAGLVHGRVNAENVLIDADGTAYLADLGLGRPGDPDEDREALMAVMRRLPASAAPVRRPRSAWVAAGAVVLAGIVALLLVTDRESPSGQEGRAAGAGGRAAQQQARELTGRRAASARDGRTLERILVPSASGAPARVLLVALRGDVFLDLVTDRRIARISVAGARPATRGLAFEEQCGPPGASGFCVRWTRDDGQSVFRHFEVVDVRRIAPR